MQRNNWKTSTVGAMLAVALACILLPFVSPLASVHAASVLAVASGNGRIYGQLQDGTKNNAPLAGQSVTLQMAQGTTSQDVAKATTDAHGNYSFSNLSTDKSITYAIYTNYQGAQYTSNLATLNSKPTQQLNLTVYDATTSTSGIAITQATLLMHAPDTQRGVFTVSEIFLFKNLTAHTYVGSLDTSKGRPNALLFSLPTGARSLTLGSDFNGYRAIQTNSGFASNAAIAPGVSQFSFSFEVPYDASVYELSYTALYPTVQFALLVPPDIHATANGLSSQGVVTAADQNTYQLYKVTTLLPDQSLRVELEGLQLPITANTSSFPAFNPMALLLLGILFLMLVVIAATWLFYRSRRYQRYQPVAQKRKGSNAKALKDMPIVPGDRREALLQELLDLDTAFEEGKLSKAVYQERRAKTKARLRNVMSEQEASSR